MQRFYERRLEDSKMKINVMISHDWTITLNVDRNESIENVKALLEVQANVMLLQQRLFYSNREIKNWETLSGLGVKNGDLLTLVSKNSSILRGRELSPYIMHSQGISQEIMLYVNIEVNGVAVKALVDSGAALSFITRSFALKCGLLRLLDDNVRGIAVGVGETEIVGRIHCAPIKIGTKFYNCPFMVFDFPETDIILGLDMLRKHKCTIDLQDNTLKLEGGQVSVPFLKEKDIPSGSGCLRVEYLA